MTLDDAIAACRPTEKMGYRGACLIFPDYSYVVYQSKDGEQIHSKHFPGVVGAVVPGPRAIESVPEEALQRTDWEPLWK